MRNYAQNYAGSLALFRVWFHVVQRYFMDYKGTLNLPKTNFPMKANLALREPETLSFWEKIGLYGLIRKKYQGKPKYILHDGPPYANGEIHIGHALNKILKDIVIKFNTMRGYDAPYVPGWDCHGLPIEYNLLKDLNLSKHQVNQVDFRKKAQNYALKFVDIQRKQFIRLGVLGDWFNPYLTLAKQYEADILRSLASLVEKGYIYHGFKPVNWCCQCETALAEAEVEYENHTSPTVYVKFPLVSQLPGQSAGQPSQPINQPTNQQTNKPINVSLLIWTTTPWTLPANVAIALNPDLFYAHIQAGNESLVLAQSRLDKLVEEKIIGDYELIGTFKGRDLEGVEYEHPFIERIGRVVLADYVSSEDGTGCVHTAPGHGQDDYLTGIKYNLAVIMPVNNKGEFDETAPEFIRGRRIREANDLIIAKLKETGFLFAASKLSHSYPHCWRCKNPIIFRATRQCFLSVSHNNLRKNALSEVKNIKWVPEIGANRISAMLENRPDWCLSRQRLWGVPIPSFYCRSCRKDILDHKVIFNFSEIVLNEGASAWFTKEVNDLLPPEFTCPFCGKNDFEKGNDIIDVWFDSGVSSQAVLKARPELNFPADLYLEGSDQHRGWFQSSLIPAIALDAKPPFKTVLTHGFVVDGEGRKMSKSEGNVISPQEIIKKYGADILRLWAASCDYREDVRISEEIITRLSESYRKIRNTLKFILGNLYDFDPKKDSASHDKLQTLDKWALSRLYSLLKEINTNYENFNFYGVYHLVYGFCIIDLSSFYLDILKDKLYTFKSTSLERRSAQTVLSEILTVLTKILAPIFSFTSEEVWQSNLEKNIEPSESVHLSAWPKLREDALNTALEKDFIRIIELRNFVLKTLEENRISGKIGSSLDAKVTIFFDKEEDYNFFKGYFPDLASIFIVSDVFIEKRDKFTPLEKIADKSIGIKGMNSQENLALSSMHAQKSGSLTGLEIIVGAASGKKCARCWKWNENVGQDSEHSLICNSCVEAIK